MAVLGILARIDINSRERIEGLIAKIDGVSTFSVEEEQRLGILVEATSVEAARVTLTEQVDRLPGVLGTWPVFMHAESDFADPAESLQGVGDEEHTP